MKQSQSLLTELHQRYPQDVLINELWLPVIRAALELQAGNAAQAIEQLQPASRYEAAAEFWPQYLRGQAYLKLNKATEATAEFQKILNACGQAALSVLYPLAQLGLAHAAQQSRDRGKARESYEKFFALWKEADTDLSVLLAAKKEYERVR